MASVVPAPDATKDALSERAAEAINKLALAALDPTAPGHVQALKSMKEVLSSESSSSSHLAGFYGNPNAFSQYNAKTTSTMGSATEAQFPLIQSSLRQEIERMLKKTDMDDEEIQGFVRSAERGFITHDESRPYFEAAFKRNEGTFKVAAFAIYRFLDPLKGDLRIGWKMIQCNVDMKLAPLFRVENHTESKKNWLRSSSRSWTTVTLVQQEGATMGQMMQAVAIATTTASLLTAPEHLRQVAIESAAALPGQPGGAPAVQLPSSTPAASSSALVPLQPAASK